MILNGSESDTTVGTGANTPKKHSDLLKATWHNLSEMGGDRIQGRFRNSEECLLRAESVDFLIQNARARLWDNNINHQNFRRTDGRTEPGSSFLLRLTSLNTSTNQYSDAITNVGRLIRSSQSQSTNSRANHRSWHNNRSRTNGRRTSSSSDDYNNVATTSTSDSSDSGPGTGTYRGNNNRNRRSRSSSRRRRSRSCCHDGPDRFLYGVGQTMKAICKTVLCGIP